MEELKGLMNVIGSDGWSAIHYACYYGHPNIIYNFIQRNANVNKVSLEGWTPLQLAIIKNRSDVFKLLIKDRTLDINMQTPKGIALHLASRDGKMNFITSLLQKNANPYLTLPNGQNALDVAYSQEVFEWLKNNS